MSMVDETPDIIIFKRALEKELAGLGVDLNTLATIEAADRITSKAIDYASLFCEKVLERKRFNGQMVKE